MSERDAETIQRIQEFQGQTRECALQMTMNAVYIQKELPNVRMSDALRERTAGLCTDLIGTQHDLIHEIFELDEVLEKDASNAEVLRRIERMAQWAWDDALKMHEIVKALEAESGKDVMKVAAYLLVSESAVNILKPLKQMRRSVEQLKAALA